MNELSDNIKSSYPNVQEKEFETPIDHFRNQGPPKKFKIRYLIDYTHFDPRIGSILFFSGGYKDIWSYYKNSPFVWGTLAKELKAVVVYGEQRYFGTSFPFGSYNDSFTNENKVYLTIE